MSNQPPKLPLWKRLFNRRAEQPKRRLGVEMDVRGRDGSRRRRGYYGFRPHTDYNDADFPNARALFDENRKTYVDPKVRGAIEYIMSHQVGPVYDNAYFKPRGTTNEAKRNAEFANEMYGLGGGEALKAGLTDYRGRGRFKGDFADRFRTISAWQFDGFSLHEEMYQWGRDRGGVERVWLSDLRPRWGGWVEGWHTNDDDELVAATLRYPGDYLNGGAGTYRLPLNEHDPETEGLKGALHIAYNIDGTADPEGRLGGLLRACYGSRRMKENAYMQLGLGLVRWGTPIPNIRVLHEMADRLGINPDDIIDAVRAARKSAESISSDAGAYLQTSDILEVELLGDGFDPSKIVELVNLLDHQMLTALFMHWLAMGIAQSHGSGSAAVTHGNAVLQVSRAIAQRTCREIERQSTARVLRWNFGERTPIPELVLPGIEPNPFAGIDVVGFANAGILTRTDDLELLARQNLPGADLNFPSRTPEERAGGGPRGGGLTGGRPSANVGRALHAAINQTLGGAE